MSEQRGIKAAREWAYRRAACLQDEDPRLTRDEALKQAWNDWRASRQAVATPDRCRSCNAALPKYETAKWCKPCSDRYHREKKKRRAGPS